jgi:hypothetical protein
MPVRLVGGGIEVGVLSAGRDAVISPDGTTQMLTPSPRRVYTSRALRRASSASAACNDPTCVWDRPRRGRMNTSHNSPLASRL